MARRKSRKVRTRSRGIIGPGYKDKPVGWKVTVGRRPGNGDTAFLACVMPRRTSSRGHRGACAYGKNPRKAMAAAFRLVAGRLNARRGSFAGVR